MVANVIGRAGVRIVEDIFVRGGKDWLSHIAMPNQKAGCSWKFHVLPVPSWLGNVLGSVGSTIFQMVAFPDPPVLE